ncbi:MAG: hypothetical protein DMF30_08595 [Verrucomicrobia bacterium]|nr:MAG: hypothetical protein DMF30_08595 [Verrucomicrobiota bacterium]
MSETRPPITAGPMARAFRFLKRTSLSCVGAGPAAFLPGPADAK